MQNLHHSSARFKMQQSDDLLDFGNPDLSEPGEDSLVSSLMMSNEADFGLGTERNDNHDSGTMFDALISTFDEDTLIEPEDSLLPQQEQQQDQFTTSAGNNDNFNGNMQGSDEFQRNQQGSLQGQQGFQNDSSYGGGSSALPIQHHNYNLPEHSGINQGNNNSGNNTMQPMMNPPQSNSFQGNPVFQRQQNNNSSEPIRRNSLQGNQVFQRMQSRNSMQPPQQTQPFQKQQSSSSIQNALRMARSGSMQGNAGFPRNHSSSSSMQNALHASSSSLKGSSVFQKHNTSTSMQNALQTSSSPLSMKSLLHRSQSMQPPQGNSMGRSMLSGNPVFQRQQQNSFSTQNAANSSSNGIRANAVFQRQQQNNNSSARTTATLANPNLRGKSMFERLHGIDHSKMHNSVSVPSIFHSTDAQNNRDTHPMVNANFSQNNNSQPRESGLIATLRASTSSSSMKDASMNRKTPSSSQMNATFSSSGQSQGNAVFQQQQQQQQYGHSQSSLHASSSVPVLRHGTANLQQQGSSTMANANFSSNAQGGSLNQNTVFQRQQFGQDNTSGGSSTNLVAALRNSTSVPAFMKSSKRSLSSMQGDSTAGTQNASFSMMPPKPKMQRSGIHLVSALRGTTSVPAFMAARQQHGSSSSSNMQNASFSMGAPATRKSNSNLIAALRSSSSGASLSVSSSVPAFHHAQQGSNRNSSSQANASFAMNNSRLTKKNSISDFLRRRCRVSTPPSQTAASRKTPTQAIQDLRARAAAKVSNKSSSMRRITSDLTALPNRRMGSPNAAFPFPGTKSKVPRDGASAAKMQIAVMDADSLLHNSCKLYPDVFDIVEGAVQLDPEAIRRKIPIVCTDVADEQSSGGTTGIPRAAAKFCYPVNIALAYGATREIIELLAQSGPEVLVFPDGGKEESSLSIALRFHAKPEILNILLQTNGSCASVPDRHSNLPLHVAARSYDGRSMSHEIIVQIHDAFPEALSQVNFHGETPVDLAVRNPSCPEVVLNYLQNASLGKIEEDVAVMDVFDH